MNVQAATWAGEFGREYTDRNHMSVEEMESKHLYWLGRSRTTLNKFFLAAVRESASILEVGCGIGNQLLCLQRMGFTNLHGIDVQDYALAIAKKRTKDIELVKGSIYELPFPDNHFEMVFTNNVLIHVHPDNIRDAMREIVRCTRRYIWGMEYWAPQYTKIKYRGHDDLLWKADFAKLYLTLCSGLYPVIKARLTRLGTSRNQDCMYLLWKEATRC